MGTKSLYTHAWIYKPWSPSPFIHTLGVYLKHKRNIVLVQAAGGILAGATASCITTPLDTIKTRLQVSQRLMVQGYSGHATYNSGLDVARKVNKADGIRGLYRGFGLSVLTYSPSTAVWWASYGASQRLFGAPSKRNIVLVQAAGGILAGATASCITTPLDTIKTRLQTCQFRSTVVTYDPLNSPITECVRKIISQTPFATIFDCFFDEKLTLSKSNNQMGLILNAYNHEDNTFSFGSTQLEIYLLDYADILGMNVDGESILDKVTSTSDFVTEAFGTGKTSIKKRDVAHAIDRELLKKPTSVIEVQD